MRTIRRWRAEGMPVMFDERGAMLVDLEVLLAWYRRKVRANPIRRAA
ncbi:MAG: hypothetical protein ACTH31_13230 [Pseudoclavibacter sp.]